jgi:uncharacterized protein GlcG (DUF336 family)
MRRYDEASSPFRSLVDYITNTSGYNFRKGQAIPIEGGLPIILDNKIIGGIGMSGGTGVQDGIAAKAGVDALK